MATAQVLFLDLQLSQVNLNVLIRKLDENFDVFFIIFQVFLSLTQINVLEIYLVSSQINVQKSKFV